jgi:hypothetical protein
MLDKDEESVGEIIISEKGGKLKVKRITNLSV